MIKVDIFSGFLGAGKTTLIKKLLKEAYSGEKVVLIENEFGDISIDGGFLQETGVTINEMAAGCICCSLKGDFTEALQQVAEQFTPDRIIIEPSGVGKLSDVIDAVNACGDFVTVNAAVAVADAKKCKMYLKNFGEFFKNQIESAGAIILSRTGIIDEGKTAEALAVIRELNPQATVITTPWEKLDGKTILEAAELKRSLTMELSALVLAEEEEEECDCHHHHHDEDGDDECCHHHHHHDEDDDEHEHHHHHHHDHEHGHHHHHADDVFSTFGTETNKKYSEDEIRAILSAVEDAEKYGMILRAKGYVDASDGGEWIYFDYVPGEAEIRRSAANVTGRLCFIGTQINESALRELLGL